jgi:hypothetical protein
MTTLAQITLRMREEAGLEAGPRSGERTISSSTWKDAHSLVDLERSVSRVLGILSELNVAVNRRDGVGHASGGEPFSRGLLYAIEEVRRLLLAVPASDRAMHELAREGEWAIATAWRAILAGDIDDLSAHIELERRARG